jgi:hypothetical protein
VIVGGAQSLDISRPQFSDTCEASAAPGERLAAEPLDQQVRHEPRMAPVAIGKGMDGGQPVVQPDGDFVSVYRLIIPA